MRKLVLICMGIFLVASSAVAQVPILAREIQEELITSSSEPGWAYKQAFKFNVGEDIGTFTGPNPNLDECEDKVFRILDQIPAALGLLSSPVEGKTPTAPIPSSLPPGLTLRMLTDPLPVYLGFIDV